MPTKTEMLFKDLNPVWYSKNIFEEGHGLPTYHVSKYWYDRSPS